MKNAPKGKVNNSIPRELQLMGELTLNQPMVLVTDIWVHKDCSTVEDQLKMEATQVEMRGRRYTGEK